MTLDVASLECLVAAVADGWPQDWSALEARADDARTRRALRNLRVIAAIANGHGTPSATPHLRGDDAGNPSIDTDDCTTLNRDQPAVEAPPVVSRWGRFVLRKKLGSGAHGDVYSAYDPQLDREVAVKLLKPLPSLSDQVRRLLDEARMLAKVRHRNVVAVYGAAEYDGQAGLWMELIRGFTLEQILHSHGPLSASEAVLVGQDVCRALAAVHRAGLVHRDVKTANVIREVGGRIVLTDFGVGQFRADRPTPGFAGTPPYVAPEVVAGSEATELSDIYSLGVLLFRLVTRTYPRMRGGLDVLHEVDRAQPFTSLRDVRSDLPEVFVCAVEQALVRNPLERPRSAGVLCAALGLVLGAPFSRRKPQSASGQATFRA
jgi:serine/threonine-protein kinase